MRVREGECVIVRKERERERVKCVYFHAIKI